MIRYSRTCLVGACLGVIAIGAGGWALSVPTGDWKIAGPFGGTATTVAVDPQSPKTVLAGAMSSLLFQSDDFGGSWSRLDVPKRNLGEVTSILIDPADSNHYLVGMLDAFGGGLYESADRGKSWTQVSDLKDVGVRALAAAPSAPSEFVAGTLRGAMLSVDSGKSWKRISDPNNPEMQGITAVAIDPKDPKIIYAGTPHLPWRTIDGGSSWQSIHSGMIDDSDVFSIYIDPGAPSDVFASACSGIYQSMDRGDLWRKLAGIPNTSRRTHVIREDPNHQGTIYAGTTMGLFKSPNSGTTWKTLTNNQVNALAFDPAQPNTMYLAMEYEGVGKSLNGGETISIANNGFVDRQISWVSTWGSQLLAIEPQEGETTGIFLSADKGETWSPMHVTRGLSGVHLRSIVGSSSEPRKLLASGPRQLYKSVDGGSVWQPIPLRVIVPPPPESPKPAAKVAARSSQSARSRSRRPVKPRPIIRTMAPSQIAGIYAVKNGTKELFLLATDLGLFVSSDMGEQWTQADLAASVNALYFAPNSDGRVVARTALGLYASKDYGDHWEKLAFPLPTSDVNDVAVGTSPDLPILVATRVGIYSSPDGGVTWYANAEGIQASTVSSIVYALQGKNAYAVEYGELFQTGDAGKSWSRVPTSLHSLSIRQLWIPDNTSNRLYAITPGLGVLFRD